MSALSIASLAVMSRRSTEVPPDAFENDDPPSISGSPVVGETLTVIPGTWIDEDGVIQGYSYKWYANDLAIPGATGTTFLITAPYQNQEISVIETAFSGTRQVSAASGAVGPVVLTFPNFPQPYYLAPNAVGSGDGSSFANAAKWNLMNVYAQAVFNQGGGTIYLASHLGTYTAAIINLSFGGTLATPCIVIGVNASLVPTEITLQGTRERPWTQGGAVGPEIFKLLPGANYLTFRKIKVKDVGSGWRATAPITQLILEDCPGDNVRRFFEDNISGVETDASVNGLTIRRCNVIGCSKDAIRVRYNSSNITIEGTDANNHMILDGMFQGPDAFGRGITIQGTTHDGVVRFVTMRRFTSGPEDNSGFYQGDGITTEQQTYNFAVSDCRAELNADEGFGLKGGPHTITDCISEGNCRNFTAWSDCVLTRCKSRDPHVMGGNSTGRGYQILSTGKPVGTRMINCSHVDLGYGGYVDRTIRAIEIEDGSPNISPLVLTNCSITTQGTQIVNDSGATVIGTPVAAPVNTVVPTYVASGAAPTQLLTAGTGTWTGAGGGFAYRHRRNEAYIFNAKASTYTRDAVEDLGVLNTVEVYGISADGYHEGAVSSAPAASNSSILLGGEPAATAIAAFTENSAEDTVIATLAVGPDDTGWTTVVTDDGPGSGRVKKSGGNLVVGATPTDYDDLTSFTISAQATKGGETTLNSTFTIQIAPVFSALYRFIKPVADGTGDGSSWDNAAHINDLNDLIGELGVALASEAPGVRGKILIAPGIHLPAEHGISNGGTADHIIEIYGSDFGGNPIGSTDQLLTFDYSKTTMTPEARLASIDFGTYDPASYTVILRGTRPAWNPSKLYRFLATSAGLLPFTDGTRVAHPFDLFHNLASGAPAAGTLLKYYARSATQAEYGTATVVAGKLERHLITWSTTGGYTSPASDAGMVDFAVAPYIAIEPANGVSSFGSNLWSFGLADPGYLDFHHLRFENFGRAVFTFVGTNVAGNSHIPVPSGHHINVSNFYCRNVADFAYAGIGSQNPTEARNLTFKHGMIYGNSKACFMWRGGCHDIHHENVWIDSGRQSRDNFATGFSTDGPDLGSSPEGTTPVAAHDITYTDCISQNAYDGIGSGYWNSDGWAASGRNSGLVFTRCLGSGATASGWDIKAPDSIWEECVAVENKENFKYWGAGNVWTDCVAHDPRIQGGSGGISNFWPAIGHSYSDDFVDGLVYKSTPLARGMLGPSQRAGQRLRIKNTVLEGINEVFITADGGSTLGETAIGHGSTIDGVAQDDTETVPTFVSAVGGGFSAANSYHIWPDTTRTYQIALLTACIDSNTALLIPPGTTDIPEIGTEWGDLAPTTEGAFRSFFGWRRLDGRTVYKEFWTFGPASVMRIIKKSMFGGVKRTGNPIVNLAVTQGTGTTMTSASTVVSVANSMVVRIWMFSQNLPSTTPAGFTLQASTQTDAGSNGTVFIDGKIRGAGTEPATVRTISAAHEWTCHSFVMPPV